LVEKIGVQEVGARTSPRFRVSQAPLEKLQAYKHRMGWSIPWASAARSDFNVDLSYSSS
jgi:predicted dithiol-disulfide oxidoreductase (DUF899 family)